MCFVAIPLYKYTLRDNDVCGWTFKEVWWKVPWGHVPSLRTPSQGLARILCWIIVGNFIYFSWTGCEMEWVQTLHYISLSSSVKQWRLYVLEKQVMHGSSGLTLRNRLTDSLVCQDALLQRYWGTGLGWENIELSKANVMRQTVKGKASDHMINSVLTAKGRLEMRK